MKTITQWTHRHKKTIFLVLIMAVVFCMLTTPAMAAGKGDVAGAMESTWKEAAKQIKAICDKVVFPALTLILGVCFFIKLSTAYFDYKKHGQFEWIAPAILLAGLVIIITVPQFIWGLVGI